MTLRDQCRKWLEQQGLLCKTYVTDYQRSESEKNKVATALESFVKSKLETSTTPSTADVDELEELEAENY